MDKDKVERGLECLTGDRDRYPDPCKGCRYINLKNYAECVKAIAKDTIALLKEQEMVVRCKDCPNKECEGRNGWIVCGITGESHDPAWFCADGKNAERR